MEEGLAQGGFLSGGDDTVSVDGESHEAGIVVVASASNHECVPGVGNHFPFFEFPLDEGSHPVVGRGSNGTGGDIVIDPKIGLDGFIGGAGTSGRQGYRGGGVFRR